MEALPTDLVGVADRVTVVLPWGSLLTAVALPSVPLLRGIRDLCQPAASLLVLLGIDAVRDRAELLRLGLPSTLEGHIRSRLAEGYASAGFHVTGERSLTSDQLARWPSRWATRLAHGRPRSVLQIEAIVR